MEITTISTICFNKCFSNLHCSQLRMPTIVKGNNYEDFLIKMDLDDHLLIDRKIKLLMKIVT